MDRKDPSVQSDLFSQWFARADKELKGDANNRQNIHMDTDWQTKALGLSNDAVSSLGELSTNEWSIGDDYNEGDNGLLNRTLLEDLMTGLESPTIHLNEENALDFLEEISLPHIQLHLRDKGGELSEQFAQKLSQHHDVWSGSYSVTQDGVVTDSDTFSDNVWPAVVLETALGRRNSFASTWLAVSKMLDKHGRIVLDRPMDLDFYRNASWNRALLYLAKETYGEESLVIHQYVLDKDFEGIRQEDALIRSSVMALSSILSGAKLLRLCPTRWRNDANFRRLARNIQLLLRHESNLSQWPDILTGSHTVDALVWDLISAANVKPSLPNDE
ncbi:MAG: methylmalonyl-CoA mutase family protein [Bacteroidota bacterium]|nr:methylmalonyl-CoA mutase family protein [Bacteroidota bacterium]MEC8032722.1 methylmalonyl-CoA mutase family protein [Bacteroidota bacterium]MEC8756815.1 methylmalonyl-CoA mutase family protein [Bacteroidota bacterium]